MVQVAVAPLGCFPSSEHLANVNSPCKRAGKAQLLLVSENPLFSIGTKRGGTLISHFPYEKC